ncbi:hypothetical protein BsWGS_19417 [Bradybaena similaris]
MDLLASDSSEDEQVTFKINENYAKNYDKWRKKEERQKLIDRYGDVGSSDSSSEGEIRSTPQMDKDWLRAYAVVAFQQPRLYKKGEKFFHDVAKPVVKHKKKATKLKDHERKFIQERGGIEDDEDAKPQEPKGKSYFEEQEEIKKSFKEALEDSSDEDSEGSSGLLVKKQKTAQEQKTEENDYLQFLKGERAELDDKEAAAELAPLKEYWNNPNLSDKERVLRDYILNNGYMDQEDSDEESEEEDDVAPNFDAEEEFLEKAEVYEHKYNFRHEEPGGDEIKSYPRVIETSVRTKDTRRAEKRKRKLEKKRADKEQRKEEIKLLQKLMREEKQEKLEALRKVANNPKLEYDLEADFDPDEHNKIMQKFFNEDYYGDANVAAVKPTFEYDADIDDEPDDWWQSRLNEEDKEADGAVLETTHGDKKKKSMGEDLKDGDLGDELYADDPNFVMDADYDPTKDYKAEKKKNKKSSKKLTQKLPLFDPTTKTFDEYIDEYLKDKIDKLPFTYREVVPNDFGLSTDEILKASEKELNSWVSIKKMSVYRSKHEELVDKRKFVAHSSNVDKKRKILPSLFEKPGGSSTGGEPKKKKKRKRKTVDSEETPASPSQEVAQGGASHETATASEQRLTTDSQNPEKSEQRLARDSQSAEKSEQRLTRDSQNPEKSEQRLARDSQNPEKSPVKAKKMKRGDGGSAELGTHDSAIVKDKSDGIELQSPQKKKKKHKQVNIDTKSVTSGGEIKTPVQSNGFSLSQPEQAKVNSDSLISNSSAVNEQRTKKAKKKRKGAQLSQVTSSSSDVTKLNKKHKKKKLSISNFGSKSNLEKDPQQVDRRQLARQLEKVMSASRLSKYGIGPNAMKMASKKRRKKKKTQTVES